jgi:hypothetical protein
MLNNQIFLTYKHFLIITFTLIAYWYLVDKISHKDDFKKHVESIIKTIIKEDTYNMIKAKPHLVSSLFCFTSGVIMNRLPVRTINFFKL